LAPRLHIVKLTAAFPVGVKCFPAFGVARVAGKVDFDIMHRQEQQQ
jgi:hypothetical protein